MRKSSLTAIGLSALGLAAICQPTMGQGKLDHKPAVSKLVQFRWYIAEPHPVEMHVPFKINGPATSYYFIGDRPWDYRQLNMRIPNDSWDKAMHRRTLEIERSNEEIRKLFR